MPKRLTKPTDVPAARADLVDMLWRFYRAAKRPAMRTIALAIENLDEDERKGTANHETIRRTFKGEAVGSWGTIEVIFLGLCELADVDPDDTEPEDGPWEDPDPPSHRDKLLKHWNHAIDEEPTRAAPRTRAERAQAEAEARQRAFLDEAPF